MPAHRSSCFESVVFQLLRHLCLEEVARGQLTAVVDSGLTADGAVCPPRQVDDKTTNPSVWRGGCTVITMRILRYLVRNTTNLSLLPAGLLRLGQCTMGRADGRSKRTEGSPHAETHAETSAVKRIYSWGFQVIIHAVG